MDEQKKVREILVFQHQQYLLFHAYGCFFKMHLQGVTFFSLFFSNRKKMKFSWVFSSYSLKLKLNRKKMKTEKNKFERERENYFENNLDYLKLLN